MKNNKSKMTLANKITISRFFFIPLMIIFAIMGKYLNPINREIFTNANVTIGQLVFVILFSLASITDFLDGLIARKYNQVSNFGKYLDPILDKILVLSAFLLLIFYNLFENNLSLNINIMLITLIITIIIIIIREFLISGFRLVVLCEANNVVAASISGKLKTAFTMLTIIILGLNGFNLKDNKTNIYYLSFTFLIITAILTIYSGIEFIIKNKTAIKKSSIAIINQEENNN